MGERRRQGALRLLALPLLAGLLSGILWIAPVRPASGDPPPSAEVIFDQPRRFAVVVETDTRIRRLVGEGDVMGNPAGENPQWSVRRIEPGRLRLQETRTGRRVWVKAGETVPALPGRRVTSTRDLAGIEYRYLQTAGMLDPEPRLQAIQEGRATLEVDIAFPASTILVAPRTDSLTPAASRAFPPLDRRLDATLLGRVRITPTGRDTYEIPSADLQQALEHGDQVLAEAWSRIRPTLSIQEGFAFRVQSPVADGVLGPRGFKVTSPNIAERAGIQMLDVILAINGQRVNDLGDVYRLYQQVRRDPRIDVVTLTLERQGQTLTKTYRIR
jgi:hypothetical protein